MLHPYNLTERFEDFSRIDQTQQLHFKLEGKRQLVQVTPFKDEWGLDWLIVVVVPESDFMEQIYASTRTTILLCLGALGMAIALGIATARWISLPIRRLSQASKAIADGELNRKVPVANIEELGILVQSFNQMSAQLWRSHQQLENYSQSLEEQVSIRTQELQQEIEERQLLEQKLHTSEAQIRAFFEAMTDIVLLVDAESQTIKAAPTHPERLYPPDTDILNQTIDQFLGEQGEIFQSQIQKALDTQQIVNFEYSLTIGTEPVWFAASIAPASENSVAWVARDLSERKQAEESLKRRAIIDSLLSEISRAFIDQNVDAAINLTLQVIGEFTHSDRSYLIAYSEDQQYMTITHEWCAADIAASTHHQQRVAIKAYPWLHEQLRSGKIVHIPQITDFPTATATERAKLKYQSLQSMVNVPTIHSGKILGAIGLNAVRSPKTWSPEEINLLKLVGEIIAIGLARHQAEVAQQQATAAAMAANQAKSKF
ncbi:MAG: HAMP domain-containing protein, partial [Symploca sp. SIO3E6]|nr:HAMP domain-containing protein [Caldora sp. SIO3E6]